MSRIPIPTTLKRPTMNQTTMSSWTGVSKTNTTFSRSSHIPVTARKPNFFTPKDKKTTSFYSTTTASKSAFTTDRKFQRSAKPAPDRDEAIRMFENLVSFLRERSYPHALPDIRRFFMSVSTTEAARLFDFLFRTLNNDFKLTQIDVDVPKILSFLKYPFIKSVTKSALVSIATRQSATNILVIYNWLVNRSRSLDGPPQYCNKDLKHMTEKEMILHFIFKCEEYEHAAGSITKYLEEQYGTDEEIEEKKTQLRTAMSEYNKIAADFDRSAAKRDECSIFQEDLQQCLEYDEQMCRYSDYRSKESKDLDAEHENVDSESYVVDLEGIDQNNVLNILETSLEKIRDTVGENVELVSPDVEMKLKEIGKDNKVILKEIEAKKISQKNFLDEINNKIAEEDAIHKKIIAEDKKLELLSRDNSKSFAEERQRELKLLETELKIREQKDRDLYRQKEIEIRNKRSLIESELREAKIQDAKMDELIETAKKFYKPIKKRLELLKRIQLPVKLDASYENGQ